MMDRPLLLDLFCGAGGCAVGYHRAGFNVLGVDHRPMPRYPFSCWQEDALHVLDRLASGKRWHGYRARDFGAIHASPPCQAFSTAAFNRPNRGIFQNGTRRGSHPNLLAPARELLVQFPGAWVVENVENAPMLPPAIRLCGLMFGLRLFRHRWFESNVLLFAPPHASHSGLRVGCGGMVSMCGDGDSLRKRNGRIPSDHRSKAAWMQASGIDWMLKAEMAQAIPPAYTEFIGRQLYRIVTNGDDHV